MDGLLPVGARVFVDDRAHRGTVRGYGTGDLTDLYSAPRGGRPVDVFYLVVLDVGAWLGGSSCAEATGPFVRTMVAHVDNVSPVDDEPEGGE